MSKLDISLFNMGAAMDAFQPPQDKVRMGDPLEMVMNTILTVAPPTALDEK